MIRPLEVGCGGRTDSSAEMSRPDHCEPEARGDTGMDGTRPPDVGVVRDKCRLTDVFCLPHLHTQKPGMFT